MRLFSATVFVFVAFASNGKWEVKDYESIEMCMAEERLWRMDQGVSESPCGEIDKKNLDIIRGYDVEWTKENES